MLVMAVRSAVSSVQLKAWALGHERFILDGSMPCSPPGLLVISSALNISGNFISSDHIALIETAAGVLGLLIK